MKQVGEYQITHANIAKGAFASIHKGKHIYSDTIVAIKEIKLNGEPIKNYIKREIEIHRSLDHPNIVRVLDVIYDSSISIYIIMEYCAYGDLQKFQKKKPFCHKYIQNYMLQLRDALQYLRTRNIVHRDLKPQNILLTSPFHIKITDFGLARYMDIEISTEMDTPSECEDLFSTYCGSPIYMSPELLNHQQYNSKSDLWSLGIIIYELITGVPPFIANNIQNLVHRVNTEKINLDNIDRTLISDDCFNLLCSLLNHDKTQRIDWDGFFKHKWFSNNIILDEENRLIENPLCYNLIDCKTNLHTIQSIHNTPVAQPIGNNQITIINHINVSEIDVIKSTSSSSNALEFSDHLHINNNTNTNSPKLERRHTSIDKSFTFSLKSSRLSEESKNKTQQIQQKSELASQNINLSDLIQDDLISAPPIPASKPINIVGRNRYNLTPPNSENSSTSTQSQMNYNTTGHSPPTRGIINALRFIKETYDYISSDNKSI